MTVDLTEIAVEKFIDYVERERRIDRLSKLAKFDNDFKQLQSNLKEGQVVDLNELNFIMLAKTKHFEKMQVEDRQEYEILYYEGILNTFARSELSLYGLKYDQFLTEYMRHFMLWTGKLGIPKNNKILRRIASYQRSTFKKGTLGDTHYSLLLHRLVYSMKMDGTLIRNIELEYEKDNPKPFLDYEKYNDLSKTVEKYTEDILKFEFIFQPKSTPPKDIQIYSDLLKDPYRRLVWGVDTMKTLTEHALTRIIDLNLYLSPDFEKRIEKFLES
ncbi:MAG: hypothetical protein IH840_08605 [Candidatus Heimdallarchaeota archaeon]|nr:hypothetical protein [Candidatus Heimdallarchaeota archaeon]